ncbi:cation channel sperm-associated protein 3-like [Myripristis murdjan]|uniref:cation channel sperm-associated protein 3-like n=1 Tax=Myripristis murdjan TaxID=586833 RepID=UPI001175D74F|nr:cation channel sperm-associated protein 3-like [Myripristis murdjan]
MEQNTEEVRNERKAPCVAEQEGSRTAQQPDRERGDAGRGPAESEQHRRRAGGLIVRIHDSPWFRIFIMAAIVLDAAVRATHSYKFLREYLHELFVFESVLLTGIYTLEFLIKVWAEGFRYLKSKSGVFDALVLGAVYLSAFRPDEAFPLTVELRAARLLKIISFIPALRDVAECLFLVMRKSLYAFFLLLLFAFFAGVCGFYFFGGPDSPDPLHWEDKSNSFLSAVVLVTLDGWTDIQDVLDNAGLKSSRIFTVLCIVLGYFILYNSCIAEMSAYMTDITTKREATRRKMEEEARALKRRARRPEGEEEIRQVRGDFQSLKEQFKTRPRSKKKVREEPCSSVNFAKLYLSAQRRLDHKTQEMSTCYDEMAEVLHELKEDQQLHEP